MVSQKVIVKNETGIHSRPAALLVTFVKRYKSVITLASQDRKANCASIIGVMALGVKCGAEIEVIADGEDEKIALLEIISFIEILRG